ncbi:MAG: ubiquinone biosynthesis protein [Alphaproteobacteria bacterium]|nr:ubiquinone biosynthesis protein [Alphaproteobacteria bacterium]
MATAPTYQKETAASNGVQFERLVYRPLVALKAIGKLLKDKEDTVQVFEIMRALSGKSIPNGYARLLETPEGGAIAYRRQELAEILSDRAFLESLPAGSVGRAYLRFTTSENISAQGLIEESMRAGNQDVERSHPFAWYGRRLRDVHDLWHVLSGYGRDAIGETCLVAFSYAQTKSLGFGFIGLVGAFKLKKELPSQPMLKAVWQAYQNGRKAKWLPGEDYIALLAEPLEAARARLNIVPPTTYFAVPAEWRNGNGSMVPAAA